MPKTLIPLSRKNPVQVTVYPISEGAKGNLAPQRYGDWKASHAKAVRQLTSRAADTMKLRVVKHDADKLENPEAYSYIPGSSADQVKQLDKQKEHHKANSRHHIFDTKLPFDLLDAIEATADWAASQRALGGELYMPEETEANKQKLWDALIRTYKLLLAASMPGQSLDSFIKAGKGIQRNTIHGTNVPNDVSAIDHEPETAAAAVLETSGDILKSQEVSHSEAENSKLQDPIVTGDGEEAHDFNLGAEKKSPSTSKENLVKEGSDEVDQLVNTDHSMAHSY